MNTNEIKIDATLPKVLNDGLFLAMEWGEDWLAPIQKRLGALHPGLNEIQLDEYNRICRDAMFHGNKLVIKLIEQRGKATREDFDLVFKSTYPWANDDNLQRLFSQGNYYAWKDGYH